MANRCLLHQNKLEAFKEWLVNDGWKLYPRKDYSEVLRAKKNKKWLIVFHKWDATQHFSVRDEDAGIVRRFLKETRI